MLSWLTARLIVCSTLALARYVHRSTHFGKHFEGALGWDADWYRRIATVGYAALPHEALRFFPLLPLLAHAIGALPGVTVGAALVVLSNGGALLYVLLLHRLAVREGLSAVAADRVVWIAALTPAAFVMVMGYAEPLSGVLGVGIALLVRARRWWPTVLPGVLAGALRPTGVVIAVFIAVEAVRCLREVPAGELLARCCAIMSPFVGLGAYLVWVGVRFGQPLAPFIVQTNHKLRGGALVSPLPAARNAMHGLLSGQISTQAPHLLWIVVALGLLVVCARRLPLSYAALAGTIIVLGATARDFQSFERYAAGAFPLLLSAAALSFTKAQATAAAAAAGGTLTAYTLLAALHLYVP